MSNLKVPVGILGPILQDVVNNAWGNSAAGNMSIGLYATNYTPANGDNAATYTAIESAFPGYARVSMAAPGAFSAPFITGVQAAVLGGLAQFIRAVGAGAPETQYGYFVLNPSGALAWAQIFPTPVVITNPGEQVIFIPQFSYLSQF